ncbi:MAG TPA: aminotransferase class I/II-fold pyridoxal phosphate-dependent enzyme [Candidatus Acidoferrales bacterium]|nr:aminotransferase class I/II-fold pyridoxal phosphate-dependent enzyme [Candidatus Acidoferrales bacterium]
MTARASLPPLASAPAETAHSGIREIANEAARTQGAIRLDVGQPDFRTPVHIGEAAKRAIDEGWTFYTHTQGLLTLRERIARKLESVNGIRTSPEQIACGPGGVGAIAAALAAVLEPGDQVLLPDPGWPNYRIMLSWTSTLGAYYPCPPELGFQPDLERLEALITPRTRLLVVNSPNNPTGAVYPEATLRALTEIAARHHLWLLSDECYDQLVFTGRAVSPATLCPDGRVISAFTFSKTYAMTGWRLGYVTGIADLIDSVTKVLESNSSCTSTITQKAAEAALDGPQDCVAEMAGAYRRRRDLVVDLLREAGLLISVPQGAFYAMADVTPSGLGSRELAFRLLRERGVSVAPGSAFGEVASGAVRISLASSDQDLREGVSRLCEFVREVGG